MSFKQKSEGNLRLRGKCKPDLLAQLHEVWYAMMEKGGMNHDP